MDMPTKFQIVSTGGAFLTMAGIDAIAHLGPVGMIAGAAGAYAIYKYGPRDVDMDAVIGTLKGQRVMSHVALPKADRVRNPEPEFEEILEFDDDYDELRSPTRLPAGMFTFSQVLQDFQPTLDRIYIGLLEDGTSVFCKAKDLCHVALAGSTGNGKSSIMRMLMSQLCVAGANVLLLNPHFTRYDLEAEIPEDWTPFEPYLLHPPMECRHFETIDFYLRQTATELLPKRLDKYAHSQRLGKPYFIVLDELPAIMENVPDAPKYLKALLQQGRKVGIYLISASQDFLVKTIDPTGKSGGAVRDCYRTAFYTGGDGTTGSTLLDMPAKNIPEDQLGKGVIMLRSGQVMKKAQQARVPYVDNDALYRMLGPSTYESDQTPDPDDEIRTLDKVMPVSAVPATPAKSNGGKLTLDAIIALAEAGKITDEQMMALIDRLPVVDSDDERYTDPEIVIEQDGPTYPPEIQEALDAFDNGATTLDKMAIALNKTPWQVRQIMPTVKRIRGVK